MRKPPLLPELLSEGRGRLRLQPTPQSAADLAFATNAAAAAASYLPGAAAACCCPMLLLFENQTLTHSQVMTLANCAYQMSLESSKRVGWLG